MIYGEICILLLSVLPTVFTVTDYCAANLCNRDKKHVACGSNWNFGYNCENPEIIQINWDYQELIINTHNSLRNKIAKGFRTLPPAKRMATMLWDNELAMLAEFNVKQCEMRYDQCHNTRKFSFSGQNIAVKKWKGYQTTVYDVIKSQMEEWFNEYKNFPLDILEKYRPSNNTVYNDFATMVQDKSTHIGCAVLKSASCGYSQQIMTCNYAYDNILDAPVYSSGQSASQCTTGINNAYPFLCSVREKYN